VSYVKQAAGNLTLAQAAAKDGLQYVGFVGLDGQPVITAVQAPAEIFGYDAARKKPVVFSGAAMPLSPLFAPVNPRGDYLAKAAVDPAAPSFASGLLPLFRGKN
jgi:hypothetical protein